jgi:putative ABC transport system permease protein
MIRLLNITAKENKRFFVIGGMGVSTGAFMVVFFLGLVAGIDQTVETKIFPEESIEVAAARSDVLDTVSLLSGGRGSSADLGEGKIRKLRSIGGVSKVFPRLRFKFPAKAYGGKEIFGIESGTDIVGEGIPSALLEGEALKVRFEDYYPLDSAMPCGGDFACGESECCFIEEGKQTGVCRHPVPFLVSNRLLEIYNTVIAPAHNLIRLPEWTVNKFRGLRLHMVVGRSYQGLASRGKPEKICLALSGISKQAIDIGISVPIEYAERWNETYAESYHRGSFSSAVLKISGKRKLGRIIQDLKSGGFAVLSKGQEEMGFFVGILNGIFIVISILMILVSAFGVSHILYSVVVERKREIGLMRALGASKRLIRNLILIQGVTVGLLGGAAGIGGAVIASYLADTIASVYLPDFPFKPDSFFIFEPWILGLAMALSLISCLAGAYFPARKAADQNPMEVLS